MRINSYLYIQQVVSAGGKNEYGASIGATAEWSDPIPCHIRTNSDNRLGKYEDGIFHQASYNILTMPLGNFATLYNNIGRVKLERRGVELGEFDVISIEPIETQNRLQIVV